MTVSFKVTNTTNIEGQEERKVEVVVLRNHAIVSVTPLKPGESGDFYAYRYQEIFIRHDFQNEAK